MTIVVFESVILLFALIFFSHINPPVIGDRVLVSVCLGVGIGIVDFLLTWFFVRRFERSKRFMHEYHQSYRGVSLARRLSWKPALIALGEELFFRGLLTSVIGWLVSNVIFSVLHPTQFKDRVFAVCIIFLYGLTFMIPLWLTGSLLGSVLAHYVFTLCRIAYFPSRL